jgi:hypothetical protein
MKKLFVAASVLALFAVAAPITQAAFISGTVDFTGTASINGTGPLNATAFTAFSGVAVDVGTGAYSGAVGAATTVHPFSFNPSSAPIANLWSFTAGGNTYSFDLMNLVLDSQGPPDDAAGLGVIRVSGTGMAHITGYSDTPATFVLHASGGVADLELAFGASTTAFPPGVPDTSNTLLLLAAGWGGLACFRRRRI